MIISGKLCSIPTLLPRNEAHRVHPVGQDGSRRRNRLSDWGVGVCRRPIRALLLGPRVLRSRTSGTGWRMPVENVLRQVNFDCRAPDEPSGPARINGFLSAPTPAHQVRLRRWGGGPLACPFSTAGSSNIPEPSRQSVDRSSCPRSRRCALLRRAGSSRVFSSIRPWPRLDQK